MLVLADRMRQDGIVSVPRSRLADILNVHESRITDRFHKAVQLRLLDRVAKGVQGRTAIYKALAQDSHVRTPKGVRGANPTEVLTPAPIPSVAKGAPVQAAKKYKPTELNEVSRKSNPKSASTRKIGDGCVVCGAREVLDEHQECSSCSLSRPA
jgi:hypothetical protein